MNSLASLVKSKKAVKREILQNQIAFWMSFYQQTKDNPVSFLVWRHFFDYGRFYGLHLCTRIVGRNYVLLDFFAFSPKKFCFLSVKISMIREQFGDGTVLQESWYQGSLQNNSQSCIGIKPRS